MEHVDDVTSVTAHRPARRLGDPLDEYFQCMSAPTVTRPHPLLHLGIDGANRTNSPHDNGIGAPEVSEQADQHVQTLERVRLLERMPQPLDAPPRGEGVEQRAGRLGDALASLRNRRVALAEAVGPG